MSCVVLASAGSGKTFRLTNRFLALLAAGEDPASILATTFTRKAAGEILDRLLGRLAEAVADDDARQTLAKQLERTISRDDAGAMLSSLVDALPRLRVLTIDALLVRMATSYGLEIGLTPGWSILDDQLDDDVKSEAIEHAVRRAPKDELFALLHMLHGEEYGVGVIDPIHTAVNNAHDAFLRAEARRAPWEHFGPTGEPLDKVEVESLLDAIEQAPLVPNKSGKPDVRFAKAVSGVLDTARDHDWEGLLKQTFVAESQAGGSYYRVPIPATLADPIAELARHAGVEAMRKLRNRNGSMFELLERFDREYSSLKRRRRAFRFDDLPRLLRGAGDIELSHLYYRLDTHVRHVLLDEFQDTSVLQFRLLEPVLDEILSAETDRSVFCVGDDKQSLYGWRDAEPGLLRRLRERWMQLEELALDENWRSSPAVLDAVNAVFRQTTVAQGLEESMGARAWSERFHEHRAAEKLSNLPGRVRLIEGAKDDDLARVLAERAAEARTHAPGASVAILLRTNKLIASVIHELDELGIEGSAEGGNPVTDSPAAAALVALFQLADHPGDSAAALQIATSPLGAVLGLTRYDDESQASRVASSLRRRFLDDGYARTIAAIAREVQPDMSERDGARVEQLVEIAERFEEDAALRPGLIARVARRYPVESPAPDAVRVLTVHRAKGLEFDAVIVGELAPRTRHDPIVVDRPDPFDEVRAISHRPTEAVQRANPDLFDACERARERSIEQELCVLYVAMTRAKRSLDLVVEEGRNPDASPAALLRATLADSGAPVLYEHTRGDWADGLVGSVGAPEPERVGLALAPPKRARVASRTPSAHESVETGLLLRGSRARLLGSAVHAMFELVAWLDDGQPSRDELGACARRLGAQQSEIDEAVALFERALEHREVRDALSRGRYPPGAHVRNERPFAEVRGDPPALIQGRIDRLVAWEGGAEVVDFKTDRVDEIDLPEAAEGYRGQLDAYRAAAARLLGLDAAAVRTMLVFTHPGRVVELPEAHG